MNGDGNREVTTFGRYRLSSRIAAGGMGEVYLATMAGAAGFEKRVVIKKILAAHSHNPEFVRRFIDEGKLLVRLSHANIVPVLDFGEVDGEYFLAMEHVDGADLREILRHLREQGRLIPIEIALFILEQVCQGLAYAHDLRDEDGRPLHVIHRDVSPSNIMLSRQGAVRLLDFGVAKAAGRLSETITGGLQGKFPYMSPEQARGEALDPRSDVFSVGTVAYEMLAGERPFEGQTELETLELVRCAEPRPLAEVCPDLPDSLTELVHECLAGDPDERPPSAAALQARLLDLRFAQAKPVGESQVAVFLRDLLGEPAPVPRPRSVDEALAEELRGAGGAAAVSRPTETVAVDRGGAPATPHTDIPSEPRTSPGGSNRLVMLGLLIVIGVLVVFNVINILQSRKLVSQAAEGPDAEALEAPAVVAVAPPAADTTPAAVDTVAQAPADSHGSAAETMETDAAPSNRALRLVGLPDDASTTVNGTEVQPDALGVVAIPAAGEVAVVVRRAGAVPFEHTVAADNQEPGQVEVVLRPARRGVLVRSEPTGARLEADGTNVGTTPKRVTVAAGRAVRVRATLPGYEEAEGTVRYDGPSTITLRLEARRLGTVAFRFFPANATIILDGKKLPTGRSNRVEMELSAGRHVLVFRSNDGKVEKRVPFVVQPGKVHRLGTFSVSETP